MKKRLFLLLTLFAVTLVVAGGVLYFFLVYRLKDSLNFIINKESKGRYAFDASDASLSIWDKHLSLKNSVLYCKDSAGSDAYYKVQIPEIYFSITSWRRLLFDKKLIVDSLAIIQPDFYIAVPKATAQKGPINFQAADIVTYLEKALTHFNVHKFSLQDAAFTYQRAGVALPLHGDHINLAVTNFTVVNNEDSHLLGSDKISVLLGRQHWILPDGHHEISFNRMTFDSKGQRFELDSFYFRQKADTGKGEIRLYADKFFFNSRHLPAIYQKNQLLLDTLVCEGPVLSIPATGGQRGARDTTASPRFKADLFKWINVGFIAVTDGQLLLQNKDGITQNTATRRANLRVYNLSVDPGKDAPLSTDSILLNLKNIEFVTPDSLYRLSVDEFAFLKNNAVFRNAEFGPVRPLDKQLSFTAPSLLLKDISIVELMQRRLKASGAELRQPRILLSDRGITDTSGGKRPSQSAAKKMALFYQTLHHVSEIMNARDFNITDGALSFRRSGVLPISADVEHFDLHIMLNRFFTSDSLADIKHAIAGLHVDKFGLVSKGVEIRARDLTFDGTHAHSVGKQAEIRTAGGLVLKVEDISWDFFDWDLFQRNKSIHIDVLHAGRLDISNSSPSPGPHATTSAPLSINIGRLTVNEILFDGNIPGGPLHFALSGLQADSFHSVDRAFAWRRMRMKGSYIGMESKKGRLDIREVDLDSDRELVIKGIDYESSGSDTGRFKLSAPQIRLNATWHSSDLSQLSIASLVSDNAQVSFSLKDSAMLTTNGLLRAGNIRPQKGGIQYDAIDLHLSQTLFKKGPLLLNIPGSSLHLSDGRIVLGKGQKPSLLSGVHFVWNDAGLKFSRDSMSLIVAGMSGSFKREAFRLSPGVPFTWRQGITGVTITKGDVHYKGKKISADAGGYSWDPFGRVLNVRNFSVQPNDSREVAFNKAQWQGDYISIKGKELTLSGIRWGTDSMLDVNKLILDGVAVEASRDKRMPFRHGIEKLMPTKLINTIPFALRVDSILVSSSHVTYNELSPVTLQWSVIPIRDINGCLVRISNRDNHGDTLRLFVAARLFDGKIRHFTYKELYGDSLSTFSASSYLSPIDLTQFSQVSVPAAAVRVIRGHADTVYAIWAGNKYATYGTMNFYYSNLRIQVLNKKDMQKRGLLPALETWLANLILPDKRQRSSDIFVQRDREKFIFNYWVKAQASGVLTTVGIKKNRKYRKLYRQIYKQYSLPERP